MSRTSAPRAAVPARRDSPPRARTQQKLEQLLSVAAGLIARQGYEQTAIRDVGRETGASVAGMYYYFKSKEDLLYQIQHRTFSSLLEAQEAAAAEGGPPEARLRRLIVGHLAFFSRRPNEMTVCAFELESLRDEMYESVEQLRRRYYKLMFSVVQELLKQAGRRDPKGLVSRHITLFLFGMLNWVFMWFDAARDAPIERLGEEMIDLVLHGLAPARPK